LLLLFFSSTKNQRKRRLLRGHEGTTDVARSPKCANSLSLSFFFFLLFFFFSLWQKQEKLERERVCFVGKEREIFALSSLAQKSSEMNELNEVSLSIQKADCR